MQIVSIDGLKQAIGFKMRTCNESGRKSLSSVYARETRVATFSSRFATLPDFALLIGIFDIALRRDLRHGGEKGGLDDDYSAWT